MASTKRETIYDEQISPLMIQIIAICKEHDMPLVFSVQLNDDRAGKTDIDENGDELPDFFCTTVLTNPTATGPFAHTAEKLVKAGAIIHRRPAPASYAGYVVSGGVAERVSGSDDGYDPGVPGAVRGRVMP